jgi:hypothetical protein
MSTVESNIVIDLYGSGVRISDGTSILADSKSYALIESDSSITVGEQAEHLVYLRPRESSTLFWDQLEERSNTKLVISNAEIAYRHLEYVWSLAKCADQPVILITPVTLNKNELGLLLGICKKISINVTGIVCNASLAMQHPINDCQAVFLDLQPQNIAITELIQTEQEVSLKQPSRVLNYGLQNFIQNSADTIAKQFVSETRFDPLHTAKDEQQFFDMLPIWLKSLNETGTTECNFSSKEKTFSIQCDKYQVQLANTKLFEDIAAHLNVLFHKHHNIAIFCSASCQKVFGLHDYLVHLPGCAVIALNDINLCKQAILNRNEIIKGKQVHYINALPWQEDTHKIPTLTFSSGKLSNLSNIPTHVLLNGYAHSLSQDLFISYSNDMQAKVLLEKSLDSLCRIYVDNLHVKVDLYDPDKVFLNKTHIDKNNTINIDDSLTIHDSMSVIQFIKVVQHET